jgi:hypothetical protein
MFRRNILPSSSGQKSKLSKVGRSSPTFRRNVLPPPTEQGSLYLFTLITNTVLFWRVVIFLDVTPWSSVQFHRRFEGTCCLHLQGLRRIKHATSKKYTACSWLLNASSTLKMGAVRSSETSVNYRITWYNILEHNSPLLFLVLHWTKLNSTKHVFRIYDSKLYEAGYEMKGGNTCIASRSCCETCLKRPIIILLNFNNALFSNRTNGACVTWIVK